MGARPARGRTWLQRVTLLALVTGFCALTLAQPGVRADPNLDVWNFLAPPLGIAAWIGAVLVWPHKKG